MFVKRIQKAYFTPLYQIPGPWHVHLTSRPLKWAILTGQRCHYVQALHQKYGPIVRIGPDEVAFADAASTKEIHSTGSRYLKLHVDIGPTPNIFSMTDPKQHNTRRRLYAKGLSQASLRQHFEPAVRDKIRLAVSKIKQDARNGTADLVKWWMLMANDVICLLTIGDGFGMLNQGGKGSRVLTAEGLHMNIAVKQFSPLLYYLGLLLSPISPTLDNIFLIGKQLYGYGINGVKAARSKSNTGADRTFFALALEDSKADNANVANARAELTDAEICVDAAGFHLAGSDTVAITLTFLVWCVLSRPALQKQLEEEVAGIVGEVTDATCEQLPLLNAVIDETLRLHGAAPTALRRVTPAGGATLGGYRIPEATVVTTQAWSLHRNPDIWNDPET
jgi:averufin monooxygenase